MAYIYDIERMKEEITPRDVAAYLGIRQYRRGKNVFIYCPEHYLRKGKYDQHASNCILGNTFEDAYYCFSCGARGSVLDLIAYNEGLDIKTDFKEICRIASESVGGAEEFILESDVFKEKRGRKRTVEYHYPILTDEQYALLGLRKKFTINTLIDVFSAAELSDQDQTLFDQRFHIVKDGVSIKKTQEFIEYTKPSYSLQKLCEDAPELYKDIILRACERKSARLLYLINGGIEKMVAQNELSLTKTDIALLRGIYKQNYIEIVGIFKAFGINVEIPQLQ